MSLLLEISSLFKNRKRYEIYTDGSLKRDQGSWSFIILQKGKIIKEASFHKKFSLQERSSNRMEFLAAIAALSYLEANSYVTLYTDSRNLADTMNLWVKDWVEQGWIKKNRSTIPDLDLIQSLYHLNLKHNIHWKWIAAHKGNKYNERCDELCKFNVN